MTFLIAYLTMLLVSGLPLFFLELSLGQWAGKGPLKVFGRMAPIAKGLGYGMLMISFLVVIYYNLIIAWTIYYTFAGFTSELPWTYCGTDSLTSRDCYQREQAMQCYNSTSGQETFWNKTCTPVADLCQFFNMTLSETELNETLGLDMKMNEAMCSNGTEDFQLNKVKSSGRSMHTVHGPPRLHLLAFEINFYKKCFFFPSKQSDIFASKITLTTRTLHLPTKTLSKLSNMTC